jgi:hypothetical protein
MGQLVVIKTPVRVRIWKSKQNYIAIIRDKPTIDALTPYINKKITLEMAGMAINARLVKLVQKGTYYVGVFLPRKLTPTWERLREKDEELNAIITITEGGEP